MGDNTLQSFFVGCHNDYILRKLLNNPTQTDYDAINKKAALEGFDLSITNDFEMALNIKIMESIYGHDWYMDLPTCPTSEYIYLSRIIDAVKQAFSEDTHE